MRKLAATLLGMGWCAAQLLRAQPFVTNDANPAIEVYMYGGAFSASSSRIPTWGYYDPNSGVDTRMSQEIVGWNTASFIPTNQTPTHYLIKHCHVTLTVNDNNTFLFDPTHDAYQTYLETNDPAYQADTDIGRPVEMFGVGYRNGYDANSFSQSPAFGSGAPGGRNAYAAGWGTNGVFVDVSNNFGKTNAAFPRFEAWPFAVGQVTNVAPGEPVPGASKVFFDLDMNDPAVITYLQESLNIGVLNFDVSALHPVFGMGGPLTYPSFTTHFNSFAPTPTRLELEAAVIRDLDTDNDGLPDDWENFYFENLNQGANDDPDHDGASNLAEYRAGTDPTKAASVFRITTTNQIALHWPNLPSRPPTVEFSSDLVHWQSVTNANIVYPVTTTAEWSDPTPSATNRFYRVRVPQP